MFAILGSGAYPILMRTEQGKLWCGKPHGDHPGPRFAEFFAGIGLVRMGLESLGWQLAYANDIDPGKREMYDAQFGDADEHFELGDVHAVDTASIPDIALATASFPCTDLSLAGGRAGLGGRQSSAFWGFRDVLVNMHERRPPLVLLENVVGFLSSRGGEDFHDALGALNALGYSVDTFMLDARWFVPQSRQRLFVVGSLLPESTHSHTALPSRVRPKAIVDFITDHPGVNWSIKPLPEPPVRSELDFADIVEHVASGSERWWSAERCAYFYGQLSDKHRAQADALIAKRRWSYATAFRRVRLQPDGKKRSMAELRTDGIAGCLRTPKGGSGRQILFKAGYGRFSVRLVSPHECARLMGADGFSITVPDNQALFGFGDAVCVPAISWIAEHYFNSLVSSAEARRSRRVALEI